MEFQDPFDPTDAELRLWASSEDGYCPQQDFDLMIATPNRIALFLEIIMDDIYKQRPFFLSCLYLMIGDAVRSDYRAYSRDFAKDIAGRCQSSGFAPLQLLAERADLLIENPHTFDYNSWCGGLLTYQTNLDA